MLKRRSSTILKKNLKKNRQQKFVIPLNDIPVDGRFSSLFDQRKFFPSRSLTFL